MKKNRMAGAAGILALSIFLMGCGSSYKADDAFYVEETSSASSWIKGESANGWSDSAAEIGEWDIAWNEEDSSVVNPESTSSSNDFVRETKETEKLVYTCSIDMETLEFKNSVATLKELIKKYEGFIESETQSDDSWGWYMNSYEKTSGTLNEYIVVRIPTEHYNSFLDDLDGTGKITNKSQNVENITKRYNNVQTTIKSLETQETRLLEMMEQATTIEDMIYIEDRLSDVQNELAMYKNNLSEMDSDVAYSTVTLRIKEVMEYTRDVEPVKTSTFMDRLKNTLRNTWSGFLDFLEDFLFFLIEVTPILLFLGAFGGIIALIIVKSVKASRKKKAAKAAQKEVKKEEEK